MPVTKQTYSATATWTATQLADLFRSAFIDAGYMTEWYAAFTNGGIVNRVMEVTYNAGATYGKTYYWFMFSSSGNPGAYYNICTGWNTSTNTPTGTLYLDNNATATNTIVAHSLFTANAFSTTTLFELIRYTSQSNPSHSWFLLRNGTAANSMKVFSISPPSHQPVSWLDLNRGMFHHLITVESWSQNLMSAIAFNSRGTIRRSIIGGSAMNGYTSSGAGNSFFTAGYSAVGRASNTTVNLSASFGTSFGSQMTSGTIVLPTGQNVSNPAFATDYNPVCTGMPYSFYLANSSLPNDFGIAIHYANNTLTALDRFIVSAGIEEWEILLPANNGTANTGASLAFCARVV